MPTLKELLWPHEYSPPWVSFKYYTNRCISEGCWKRVLPGVDMQGNDWHCCEDHAIGTVWFISQLRNHFQADPLLRWQIEEQCKEHIPPPHSIWWRVSLLWRKDRR
jgi:hypothetical protein